MDFRNVEKRMYVHVGIIDVPEAGFGIYRKCHRLNKVA